MAIQIAVCGPRAATEQDAANAFQVGALLAEKGAVVICGGGVGVMASVAAGVKSRGGTVIGIRPTATKEDASPDLSVTIVTNLGEARNAIIVWSADAVIAIGGSWGTLSEVALAKRRGDIRVVSLGGWRMIDASGHPVPGIDHADNAEQAVLLALENL